jgi:hypothetical protein
MTARPVPHPLTERQVEILRYLLRHDLPGYDALRQQVTGGTVTRYWSDDEFGFEMSVDSRAAAQLADGPHADAEWGWTEQGEPEGNLMIWVEGGRLAALEYGWVSDSEPAELPPLDRIREPRPDELGKG